MIDCTPEIMRLASDLHEDLVEVPLPLRDLAHVACPPHPDLAGKHRPKPIYPSSNTLMADVNSTLVKEVFDVAKGQRKTNVHHDRELDNLGRRFEVAEWIAGHEAKLARLPSSLNRPVLLTMPHRKLDDLRRRLEVTKRRVGHSLP